MLELSIFYRLACALALGLMVGLQREHSFSADPEGFSFAGVRTFSVAGLLGAIAAMLSTLMNSVAPFICCFAILGFLLTISHQSITRGNDKSKPGPGLTTCIAMMLIFLLGALCWYDKLLEAMIIAVALLWLLNAKNQLHSLAKKISKEDIVATIKFAVISAIILPILPNQAYGPAGLEVLNPYKIWLFVVFISAISFVGYILVKVIGPGKGIGITGILGGIASSTALTLNMTQRSRENPNFSGSLSMGVVIAWSIMFLRLYIICGLINPVFWKPLFFPMILPALPGLIYAIYLKYRERTVKAGEEDAFINPFQLLPALKFGGVFAVILFVSNAARVYFGADVFLISCFFAGLADMDAIAISALEMTRADTISVRAACVAIMIAGIANTFFKGILVFIWGSVAMKKAVFPVFLAIIAVIAAILLVLI
ncbi:MAG: MgtC/SapB family protein [Fibrobacter sp.]|jgi:uncharacterized membrane protein (DUF4010 family)|nr:MgtC/SapB family protein [Fibrobacter sp.]